MTQSQVKEDKVILSAFQKKVIADRPGFHLDPNNGIQPCISRNYGNKKARGRYNLINLTDGKKTISVVEWL